MREKFRVWTEDFGTFLLEVVLEKRGGARAAIVRAILLVLSKFFQVAIKTRRFLYNVRILRDSTLGVQVIAIGNLTVGGTGKTPVVEKFAQRAARPGPHGRHSFARVSLQRPAVVINGSSTRSFSATTPRRPAWYPMANHCCSIRKWPVTNRTCWLRISKTSWCWWTRTA